MDHTRTRSAGHRPRKKQEERRTVERHVFSETAEVLDVAVGTRLTGRVADISLEGCYVDTFNPFPLETLVRIKISRNGAEFVCAGAVRNSQTGMGMGITFAEVSGPDRELLESWIGGNSASSVSSPIARHESESPAFSAPGPDGDALARRLIDLLRKKGQLSDSDVADLFVNEPL